MTEAVKMWTLFAPDGSIVDWGPDKAGLLHVAHQGYATEAEAEATYSSGYFYCKGTPPEEGPDYYMGDVLAYNDGFLLG